MGRPNVGKSTLFNRLVGRRIALVEDEPGVTRDRHYADVDWDGRPLRSWTPAASSRRSSIAHEQVRQQAQLAVEEAAAVVLVVDGRDGLTTLDRAVADLLRRTGGKRLFVAVNKVDNARTEEDVPLAEFYALGFGDVFAVSAEHGRGVGDLMDALVERLELPEAPPAPEDADEPRRSPRRIGRRATSGSPSWDGPTWARAPCDALLGEERFVVTEVPAPPATPSTRC